MEILGYYMDFYRDVTGRGVYVPYVFEVVAEIGGNIILVHSPYDNTESKIHKAGLEECIPISKEVYLELSKHIPHIQNIRGIRNNPNYR